MTSTSAGKTFTTCSLGTPVYGEMEYNRHFGPADYSFNIGKAHVVTMKNINYVGGRHYIEGMTGAQAGMAEERPELCAEGDARAA